MKQRAVIYLGLRKEQLTNTDRAKMAKRLVDAQFKSCLDAILAMGALIVTFYADLADPSDGSDRTGPVALLRDLKRTNNDIDVVVVDDGSCLDASPLRRDEVVFSIRGVGVALHIVSLSDARKAA